MNGEARSELPCSVRKDAGVEVLGLASIPPSVDPVFVKRALIRASAAFSVLYDHPHVPRPPPPNCRPLSAKRPDDAPWRLVVRVALDDRL